MANKAIQTKRAIILPLFILLLLGGWYSHNNRPVSVNQGFIAMDTFVEIRATGPKAEAALKAAQGELRRVEGLFNRFQEGTQVSALNQAAGRERIRVTADTKFLLERGIYYGELSQGTFDITIGKLADLWGFGTDDRKVPDSQDIDHVLELTDYNFIQIDADQAFLTKEGVTLDLGGIAKGYAVDQGAQVLKDHGIRHGLVNAGGDIYAIGTRPDNRPWRVGIQDPKQPEKILAAISLIDQAIASSGDYQRFFIENGQHYHHILDPRTGYPARGLSSVSIIASTVLDADALSTAVFVLGAQEGLALVESLDDVEALIVTEDDEIIISSGLEGQVEILRGQ